MASEVDKLLAVLGDAETIGNFLEWLSKQARLGPTSGKGHKAAVAATRMNSAPISICLWHDNSGWTPTNLRLDEILARYFEIDMAKVEREKLEILKGLSQED